MGDKSQFNAASKDPRSCECRICLNNVSRHLLSGDIFNDKPESQEYTSLAAELARLANVEVPDVRGYPRRICRLCHEKFLSVTYFIKQVRTSEQTLKNRLQHVQADPVQKWPKPIDLEKNLNGEVIRNSMELEIKKEVESDHETEDIEMDEDNREDNLSLSDIKVEPEDITEHPAIQVTVNGTISHDQHNETPSITNGCEVYENEEYLDSNVESSIKEEPLSDEEAPADLPMDCMLCTKQFNTLSGLKAHVIAYHNYKSVKRKPEGRVSTDDVKIVKYICAICKRKFTTSTDLKVHQVCHVNFSCYACNGKFNSFSEVAEHRNKCSLIVTESEIAKPKTLTDILKERLAQKQKDEANDSGSLTKQHPEEKLEIEIDIKNEINNYQIQIKTEVDYTKIENELESMFKVANENASPNISKETNKTESDKDNKEKRKDSEEMITVNTAKLNLNDNVLDKKTHTIESEQDHDDAKIVNESKDMDNDSKGIGEGTISICAEDKVDISESEKPKEAKVWKLSEDKKKTEDIAMKVLKPDEINHNKNTELEKESDAADAKQIPNDSSVMEIDTPDKSSHNENTELEIESKAKQTPNDSVTKIDTPNKSTHNKNTKSKNNSNDKQIVKVNDLGVNIPNEIKHNKTTEPATAEDSLMEVDTSINEDENGELKENKSKSEFKSCENSKANEKTESDKESIIETDGS